MSKKTTRGLQNKAQEMGTQLQHKSPGTNISILVYLTLTLSQLTACEKPEKQLLDRPILQVLMYVES